MLNRLIRPRPATLAGRALFEAAAVQAQHDAQAAVRWLRAHAADLGVDPSRIAIGGGSAGADVALLVGAHSEDPGTSGTPGQSSSSMRSALTGCPG